MKYFLDTNIIIYAIKNSYPAIRHHFLSVPAQSIVIPSIVLAEIEYGARKSFAYNKTITLYKKFTDVFEKADFTPKCAEIYGCIRAALEAEGRIIGNNDMLIAAITMADDGVLITHNTKEFSRIDGLKLEDWTEKD